jgi:hypothetical protein
MAGPEAFTSTIPRYEGHATTLVVHCSQFDYQAQIDDFVRTGLQIPSFDRIAVPGGPQFFHEIRHLPKLRWSGTYWTKFLLDRHNLEEVILIAHEACGWYKEILGIDTLPEVLRQRETHDLRESLGMAPRLLPQRKVSARIFYAEVTSENYIRFVPVL